jgi:hypothetical protein
MSRYVNTTGDEQMNATITARALADRQALGVLKDRFAEVPTDRPLADRFR